MQHLSDSMFVTAGKAKTSPSAINLDMVKCSSHSYYKLNPLHAGASLKI